MVARGVWLTGLAGVVCEDDPIGLRAPGEGMWVYRATRDVAEKVRRKTKSGIFVVTPAPALTSLECGRERLCGFDHARLFFSARSFLSFALLLLGSSSAGVALVPLKPVLGPATA